MKNLKKGDIIFIEAKNQETEESKGYRKLCVVANYKGHIACYFCDDPDKDECMLKHNELNDWFKDDPINVEEKKVGYLSGKLIQLKKELKNYF